MKAGMLIVSVVLVGSFFNAAPHPAFAAGDQVYTVIVRKQEEKKKTRWTLSEWLETRDRMVMMDLWLAMNSPSPFEFYLGGNYTFGQSSYVSPYRPIQAYFAAYAKIFGLEVQHSFNSGLRDWQGIFHLRLFGYHNQATNLTLEGGARYQTLQAPFTIPFAGTSLSLYLAKYFGIDGLFRYYFSQGIRWEGGAFIDFSFIRVYGNYFRERQDARSGITAGLRFYF